MRRVLSLLGLSLIVFGVYLLYDSHSYNAKLNSEIHNELYSNHIVEVTSAPEVTNKKHKVKKKGKVYKNVLKISELKLVAPILPDISRESLRKGVGHYPETVPIGEKGNCVLAGHSSYVYDCIFNSLHKIKRGTKIKVYDKKSKEFDYVVTDIKKVKPTDVFILESKDFSTSYLTLLTCTDYGKNRFIVVSELKE